MTTHATTSKYRLIETATERGAYDMQYTHAIVEDKDGNRYYIHEGFGGMDSIAGGMYRWRHGLMYAIPESNKGTNLDDINTADESPRDRWSVVDISGAALGRLARAVKA